ncbi:mannose-6-phosphate isomerase, class I [Alkalihalobacillus sp. 1P02AB]|uniref:mannose-6-phosphate isomerase, class I n=1 Tax=Alkalihalobacillus sp. 1P02AB TaxID=3132260 RepID=UPI0039A698B8
MREPLFLEPIFHERIWGGEKLKSEFGYAIPTNKTGECWAISAHPNGPCPIKNGKLEGHTLNQVWESHRKLFGYEEGEQFPLLVKILDATEDLSVQVHPNDNYASIYENGQLGKNECWYIIDCEENAEIIFGHNASSREELIELINQEDWNALLRRVKVKPGDFFVVPSGTIHAIGAGITILEIQQNSDLTYRVYDYNRTDDKGNRREVHIDQSIVVTTVPHQDMQRKQEVIRKNGLTQVCLEQGDYFTVYHWELFGDFSGKIDNKYLLVSVLDGEATLIVEGSTYEITKGAHFILPTTLSNYQLKGEAEMIVSHT